MKIPHLKKKQAIRFRLKKMSTGYKIGLGKEMQLKKKKTDYKY